MRNIVLARVDDRLIHGEVVMGWMPATRTTRLIIVDDELCRDPFARKILMTMAPAEIRCFVYTVEQAAVHLTKAPMPHERLMVLAKSPLTFWRLIEKGVEIKEVNLGGTGIDDNRRPFFKNISLSRDEVESVEKMLEHGCDVYYQLVPDQKRYELENAVAEAKEQFGA